MAILKFDESSMLGTVREVDTRKVSVLVEKDEDLKRARVGHLVAIELSGASETWLIAIIERVIRFVGQQDSQDDETKKGSRVHKGLLKATSKRRIPDHTNRINKGVC